MGVVSGVVKCGREHKKFGGICNWDPKGSNKLMKKLYEINIYSVENKGPSWLGPSFKPSIP